ncbi:MAG: glycosyltransferase family 2 protein [Alteromonadaceae bacterium]|nr:glycosyltransferase family 2 protein [Alteromonadaceae bacterium]
MSQDVSSAKIAVVIATKDRYRTLSERSIPSVVGQSHCPEFLILVDDSSPETRPLNATLVEALHLPSCEVSYHENKRSPGASGSWNTAIDILFTKVSDPENLFVAVLDDDDSWSADYLKECVSAVDERQLDMVAADLRRFESLGGKPSIEKAPAELLAEEFLTGNPGIQGSNLFIRLSLLLSAGGFDEELRSCTDRDLCIRLADLGDVRYGRLPLALVDHFADPGRPRLSTKGSAAKLEGLTTFWKKYFGRMSPDQRAAFSERASSLFAWCPPAKPASPVTPTGDDAKKKALVLGLVADNENPREFLNVINALANCLDERLVGLDVVLIERGPRLGDSRLIDIAASNLREAGRGCFRVPLERQAHDREVTRDHRSVSFPESDASDFEYYVLSFYCARVADARIGTEIWLATGATGLGEACKHNRIQDILRWMGATKLLSTGIPNSVDSSLVDRLSTLDKWLEQERIATAEHRVKSRFPVEHIRVLGHGSEAVVFTDDRTVYKCIDYWKTRMPRSQLDFLREQSGRWADMPGLYAIHNVVEDGPWALLTYDYEESTPFDGGHEHDLIDLLNGCCKAGIVCNNIHPKNLVVTGSGVKLIDYGSDIRPWTPLGFEHMARRAFLTSRYANHPDLQQLMRRALKDQHLPELADYKIFRSRLLEPPRTVYRSQFPNRIEMEAPLHEPFVLFVGVITSDPAMLSPLLSGLAWLQREACIKSLKTLILDNGCPEAELKDAVQHARLTGLNVAVISQSKQFEDATEGAFGKAFRKRVDGQAGIAQARTMLQRYLGNLMAQSVGSFGWILDDDMRVDERAKAYLPWLPAFREQGTDALIGAYEGSSPNPPLNGLRVHLVDLYHNLVWLRNLPQGNLLPDRSDENAALRAKYPDYYYDLSRKHSGHLEMPHWLEPAHQTETVSEARSRLIAGALGILNGDPLTRPIVATLPSDPLASAKKSVNRGGCTFVLNPDALTRTPNTVTLIQGREARRSDMIWAIVNRYYRRMDIRAVGFPIHHVGRVTDIPDINSEKVQGEIVGSALYAGLSEFFEARPENELNFALPEIKQVQRLIKKHMDLRLCSLEQSFFRIAGLRESIRKIAVPGELDDLIDHLDRLFTRDEFNQIRSGVRTLCERDVSEFLASLSSIADDFALATVNTEFIMEQFSSGPVKK